MIAALYLRMCDWLGANLMAPARRQPLRAAVLNTGELVLVDAFGNAQVLSVETTDMVRDVLEASSAIHPPIFPETSDTDGKELSARIKQSTGRVIAEQPFHQATRRMRAAGGC